MAAAARSGASGAAGLPASAIARRPRADPMLTSRDVTAGLCGRPTARGLAGLGLLRCLPGRGRPPGRAGPTRAGTPLRGGGAGRGRAPSPGCGPALAGARRLPRNPRGRARRRQLRHSASQRPRAAPAPRPNAVRRARVSLSPGRWALGHEARRADHL